MSENNNSLDNCNKDKKSSLWDYFYPNFSKTWKCILTLAIIFAGIVYGGITICKIFNEPSSSSKPEWAKNALIIWAVVPPLWFWFDYFFIWKTENLKDDPIALEKFKYGQSVSRNVWLAFVVLLAAFYFKS
tara:strand:- start:18402 stop:18794 length:393 start_codon:yes stop_codon:yes gene_type:complete